MSKNKHISTIHYSSNWKLVAYLLMERVNDIMVYSPNKLIRIGGLQVQAITRHKKVPVAWFHVYMSLHINDPLIRNHLIESICRMVNHNPNEHKFFIHIYEDVTHEGWAIFVPLGESLNTVVTTANVLYNRRTIQPSLSS